MSDPPGLSDELVDFDGRSYHCKATSSPDGQWKVAYGKAPSEERSRVFVATDDELAYSSAVSRPQGASIANNGTALVIGGGSFDKLDGEVRVFDATGSVIIEEAFLTNVHAGVISPDGTWGAVLARPPEAGIHLINVETAERSRVRGIDDEGIELRGFTRHGGTHLLYAQREGRSEPYFAIDTDGELAWRSESYRDTESLLKRIRGWVNSR